MEASSKPAACVVGAGFVGPAHIEALRRIGVEVRALVGSTLEDARKKASLWGVPQAYSSLEDALASSGADVYHLAVPNVLHTPYSKLILKAGRHVVCEKPLSLNSAESEELVSLARSKRLVAAVAYNLRYYPMVHEARARVASGGLGTIHAAHGTYLQDWLLLDTDWNWRLDPEKGGPLRAVADIGTHWLDMVCWVTGLSIVKVFADFSAVHPVRRRPEGPTTTFSGPVHQNRAEVRVTTEDQAAILLRFENGAQGSLFVSQTSAGRKNSLAFQLDGDKGALSWTSDDANRLWLGHRDRANEILEKDPALLATSAKNLSSYPGGHGEGYPDTFKQFCRAVYDYISAGDMSAPRNFPTFGDGHREMQYCDALLESARSGRWIELPPRRPL